MRKSWTSSFRTLHKELFAGYDCSRCRKLLQDVLREYSEADLARDASIWGLQKSSLLRSI